MMFKGFKRLKMSVEIVDFVKIQRGILSLVLKFQKVYFSLGLQGQERPYWQKLFQGRQMFHSSLLWFRFYEMFVGLC